MLTASIFYMQNLSSKTQRLEAAIEQLAHSKNPRSSANINHKLNSKESIKARDEIAALNVAISEIVTPWTSIFKTLEAIEHEDIKLMSIEPNAKKQAVRINAVAIDVDSMMQYIDDLSQQKLLKNVTLITQENADINGLPALHFVVEAQW